LKFIPTPFLYLTKGRRPVRAAFRIALTSAAVALGMTAQPGASEAPGQAPDRLERAFVHGGQILMELSAGQYVIEGTADPKIRVSWRTEDPADMRTVQANIGIAKNAARIDVDGPSNNFRVAMQVPKRSDLTLNLSAGDLTVQGIEGHKDISAWAGELKIGVGKAADYRTAAASVTAGDLRATAFSIVKEGLFRSFQQQGRGKYDLKVRLTAGKIVLEEEEPGEHRDEKWKSGKVEK
jgi:hypothetical protein